MMVSIWLAIVIACFAILTGGSADEVLGGKTTVGVQVEGAGSTKLTPTVEDTKGKTEKRDSSDQTDSVYAIKPNKDGPFRPIYSSPSSSVYPYDAASAPIFQPTTVRYTAAEAAPQSYYEKPENGGGIRYSPVLPTAPPTPVVEQPKQGHRIGVHGVPHRFSFAVPPQVELYQRPAVNYAEINPEVGSSIYERAGPQQYHLTAAVLPQEQYHAALQRKYQQVSSPAPVAAPAQPGQRVQYIIAIPLSYMRQLQQQLLTPTPTSGTTSTSTTSTSTPTTAPPAPHRQPIMQLFGPLARDHQGMYRPYYQSDSASAPPTASTQPPQQQQQHYLQIPASVLLAAAQQWQQRQQQHQQQHQQQQQQSLYANVAPPSAATLYQPLIYQHSAAAPQLQLQRVYQPAAIYNEHPGSPLYAYTQQQQQQQRIKQQQQHKYTPAAPSVAAPTPTAAIAASTRQPAPTAAAAATTQHQQQQQQQQPLPIVHYNPIYVQAPPIEQQQQQQQHQFAISPRFSNNIPKAAYNLAHESTPPIQVVRLSAANTLPHALAPSPPPAPPIHHYHHYQGMPGPMQQQFYHGPQQYVSPYVEGVTPAVAIAGPSPGPGTSALSAAASPAIIPYFSHPGAVHYGTHLYHPAAAATATTAIASPKQHASTATATSGGHLPGGTKTPSLPAAANIVKYP